MDRAELGAFLKDAPGATFFHTPAWMESICASFAGMRNMWLTAREGPGLAGVMPVCVARKGPLHSLYAMPFGTYGTPLAEDPSARKAILGLYAKMADARGCASSAASLFGMSADGLPAGLRGVRSEECCIIPLGGGFDEYRSGAISGKKRQICNRCEREGIVVRTLSGAGEFERFYEVYSRGSVHWGGVHPYPRAFLAELYGRADEGVLFWGAFRDSELLGGHIDLYFGASAQAWQAGMPPGSHDTGISSYLVYNAVREAMARGASVFNLGSSGGDQGMIFFKESMGGKKMQYPVMETRKWWWSLLRRK